MIKGLRKYYAFLHVTNTILRDKAGQVSKVAKHIRHPNININLRFLRHIREMKLLGILLCAIGSLIGFYAININTQVPVRHYDEAAISLPDSVNNLGLMQKRYDYLFIAGGLCMIGLVLILTSKPVQAASERYTEHYELAKRAEFKGKFTEAIDHYMDAVYFVEEDFIAHSDKHLQEKEDFVFRLWTKIDELKKIVEGESRTIYKKSV